MSYLLFYLGQYLVEIQGNLAFLPKKNRGLSLTGMR